MLNSVNFGFLSVHDAQLVQLAALAESYFRTDPSTAIFKLRQFAELLCKQIAARQGVYGGERERFEETLRRLSYERIIPKEVADLFHALRRAGNSAALLPTAAPSSSRSRRRAAFNSATRAALTTIAALSRTKRNDQGTDGCWRCFTHEEIAARDANLVIFWLRDMKAEAEEQSTEPDGIAAAIIGHLKAALEEVEALSEQLEPNDKAESIVPVAEAAE